jgi:hypothetical protein
MIAGWLPHACGAPHACALKLQTMRSCFFAFCLVALTACDHTMTGPTVPLNSEFVLAPGSAATIDQASVSVRFNDVNRDSRCPGDATCLQAHAGDAIVRVTATSDRGTRDYELHTGSPASVQHDDLTISLVQLSPYPFGSRAIAPGEYRATLRVTR